MAIQQPWQCNTLVHPIMRFFRKFVKKWNWKISLFWSMNFEVWNQTIHFPWILKRIFCFFPVRSIICGEWINLFMVAKFSCPSLSLEPGPPLASQDVDTKIQVSSILFFRDFYINLFKSSLDELKCIMQCKCCVNSCWNYCFGMNDPKQKSVDNQYTFLKSSLNSGQGEPQM